MRAWLARTAPLILLAACEGPSAGPSTPAPTSKPAGPAPPTAPPAAKPPASPAAGPSPSPAGSRVAQALPSCVVTPQQTEGPYFVDERLDRSDIRSDPSDGTLKDGVPLRLVMQVSQISGSACTPLVGAQVDLWQCDALGVYSDVQDPGFVTSGKMFLRGYQVTDQSGSVQFTTIFPGWYQGRAVHIHFKVRTTPDSEEGYELTSQFYFDDAITDQVHAQPPYAQKGQRTLRNAQDGIFRNGGSQLMLPLNQDGQGYAATFNLGLQMN